MSNNKSKSLNIQSNVEIIHLMDAEWQSRGQCFYSFDCFIIFGLSFFASGETAKIFK